MAHVPQVKLDKIVIAIAVVLVIDAIKPFFPPIVDKLLIAVGILLASKPVFKAGE